MMSRKEFERQNEELKKHGCELIEQPPHPAGAVAWALLAALVGLLVFALTRPASAVEATRSWTHPDPDDVAGFTLHLRRTATGDFTESVSLGAVSPASVNPETGEATYTDTFEVGDLPVWGALRAHNEFGESDFSNEKRFAIPEPPQWAMVSGALATLIIIRRRRHDHHHGS